MPIYVYVCDKCHDELKVKHSIKEKLTDCTSCDQKDALRRVPSTFSSPSKQKSNEKVGNVVKDFITKSQEELVEQKKELKRDR